LNKLKVTQLPADFTWGHVVGMGFLAGIGFTMSLFVTNLAFEDAALIREAKVGIFIASTISGILGYVILNQVLKRKTETKADVKEDYSSTLGTRK
jgi:Na+:H+ antiporter, NhaA family